MRPPERLAPLHSQTGVPPVVPGHAADERGQTQPTNTPPTMGAAGEPQHAAANGSDPQFPVSQPALVV